MCMGLPSVLTTDNGSEFRNKLNTVMMKLLGIRHSVITPYHPQVQSHHVYFICLHICVYEQSNGLDERYNQTLQRMLSKAAMGHKKMWDEFIDSAAFAYNTSTHESTAYTPFEVVWQKSKATS